VIEGYWDDDFGRARNASLDHCQGEWILWIDADERFASPDNPILRQALRGLSGDALAVEIYNLGDDPGDSNVNIHRALRIFRRDRCRWYGAIHEQVDLQPGLEDTLMVVPVKGAHIDHIGYRTDVVNERDKLARNLRLAHAARASGNAHRGQEGVADLNVARALAAMGRFPEAQGYFDSALEQVGPGIALRATLLFSAQNLTQCGQFERSIEQALQLREDCEQKGLTYFLEGVALRRMGRTTQAIEALEKVDGLTSEDGFAFPETFLRAELAGALCEADRMGEAADYLALMVAESPDVLTIRTALKVFAATGKSLADLAAAMPENRLEKVAAALILVPPVVADSAAEALYTRFGPRPQLLAAAIRFAPMVATARALDWSARLRSIGLSEPCPLIAQAKIEVLEVPARIRAAVTAHAAFNDERGAKLAMALAVGLKEHELDAVTREISLIDPALAGDFARAVAAVPDLSEAGAAQFTNHNRPVTDTSPPTAQLAAMSTDQ
jgi:tetratricopeptide (TPR) repeat protein